MQYPKFKKNKKAPFRFHYLGADCMLVKCFFNPNYREKIQG